MESRERNLKMHADSECNSERLAHLLFRVVKYSKDDSNAKLISNQKTNTRQIEKNIKSGKRNALDNANLLITTFNCFENEVREQTINCGCHSLSLTASRVAVDFER